MWRKLHKVRAPLLNFSRLIFLTYLNFLSTFFSSWASLCDIKRIKSLACRWFSFPAWKTKYTPIKIIIYPGVLTRPMGTMAQQFKLLCLSFTPTQTSFAKTKEGFISLQNPILYAVNYGVTKCIIQCVLSHCWVLIIWLLWASNAPIHAHFTQYIQEGGVLALHIGEGGGGRACAVCTAPAKQAGGVCCRSLH